MKRSTYVGTAKRNPGLRLVEIARTAQNSEFKQSLTIAIDERRAE